MASILKRFEALTKDPRFVKKLNQSIRESNSTDISEDDIKKYKLAAMGFEVYKQEKGIL